MDGKDVVAMARTGENTCIVIITIVLVTAVYCQNVGTP